MHALKICLLHWNACIINSDLSSSNVNTNARKINSQQHYKNRHSTPNVNTKQPKAKTNTNNTKYTTHPTNTNKNSKQNISANIQTQITQHRQTKT